MNKKTLFDKRLKGNEIVAETFEGLYREEDIKLHIKNVEKKLKEKMKRYYYKDTNSLVISLEFFKYELEEIFSSEFGGLKNGN